jgi:glycosyltransferase involved in cell wall biosynthesis
MTPYDSEVLTQTIDSPPTSVSTARRVRRVLVISYDFPPNRTSAVYRMTGLTRSLPQCGWEPTVVTIQGGDFTQEPELLKKIPPEVEIVRTKCLRIDAWENRTAGTIQRVGGLQPEAQGVRKPRRLDRYLRAFAAVVRSTLYFPDETIGWVPYALWAAIKLHQKNPFDVIYTTNPPRSSALVGLMLKRLLGVPLVTEFMDPWYPQARPLRRKSEEWLMTQLLRKSERVVVMVRQHAEELIGSFGVPAEKLVVVRNGFFEEDFVSIEHTEPNDLDPAYFHFSHFGTIYPGNQGNFFTALAELVRERSELRNQIRLHLVGFPCEEVLRYTQESALKDITEFHGFLPKREDALQMMRSSDCLVLCWGRPDFSRLAIAGKTYDYLRVGRPIVAVTAEGGGVEELVKQAQAGWAVSPNDTDGIKRVLTQVLGDLRKTRLNGPLRPEYVAQFRWDRLAQLLARAFEDTVRHAT